MHTREAAALWPPFKARVGRCTLALGSSKTVCSSDMLLLFCSLVVGGMGEWPCVGRVQRLGAARCRGRADVCVTDPLSVRLSSCNHRSTRQHSTAGPSQDSSVLTKRSVQIP